MLQVGGRPALLLVCVPLSSGFSWATSAFFGFSLPPDPVQGRGEGADFSSVLMATQAGACLSGLWVAPRGRDKDWELPIEGCLLIWGWCLSQPGLYRALGQSAPPRKGVCSAADWHHSVMGAVGVPQGPAGLTPPTKGFCSSFSLLATVGTTWVQTTGYFFQRAFFNFCVACCSSF